MIKAITYINFVLTLVLIGCFAWLVVYLQKPVEVVNRMVQGDNNVTYVDKCGDDCKKQITEILNSNKTVAVEPIIKETTKTVVITPIPTKEKAQTAYIPIAGGISTTSLDWYDAPGTEFYLNFNTDYGKTAYANWHAFLQTANGNGTAYARLYDVTNKIAVNGSEVSATSSGESTQVISGALSFWAGNNLYRVQIKSLNTYATTFGSGRVKIIY